MKFSFAVVALSVALASNAFAQEASKDVCGIRTKSIPLLGTVAYNYTHKGDTLKLEITTLSGAGSSVMISKGLKDGVEEALPGNSAEAARVNAFLSAQTLAVGTVVKMSIENGKAIILVGDKKSDGFTADLLPGLAKVIENKLTTGDGGSRVVPCK